MNKSQTSIKLVQEQVFSPVFLYGYSMGARLALSLAIEKPNLLQGLILESGTFGIEVEAERQARQALDGARADQIIGNFDNFLNEWQNMNLFKYDVEDNDLKKFKKIKTHIGWLILIRIWNWNNAVTSR